MAGRHTNLALLWATILALVTGGAAFTVGTSGGRWVIVAHGVVALAIIVLAPWKTVIARRGIRRRGPGRGLSVGLTVVTLLALVTGVALVTGSVNSIGPFTIMQLHVALGLLTVSLTVIHTLQRPAAHRATDLSKRNALRVGALLTAAGGLWLTVESLVHFTGARGSERRFTGSHEIVDAEDVPFTQWINDTVQHLDPETHRISILGTDHSVVELAMTGDVIEATLDCTGGWYTTQEWAGTRLDHLLGSAQGQSVVVRSVTGYWRRFPLAQAPLLLLATHVAGSLLRDGNGGPVRLVAPDRRGYWWVKWVAAIDVDDRPSWWQPPLPTA